ncbi:hypothetical protein IAT40_002082 [Kwoniella sp. CBS 6097]
MSDSEDDFMSDKFLIDLPSTSSSSTSSSNRNKSSTYTEKRNAQSLKSMRRGQANNKIPLKLLEEQRRREGLNTSLFEGYLPTAGDTSSNSGPLSSGRNGSGIGNGSANGSGSAGTSKTGASNNKALGMMMKMGWKAGEGLGKKRSPSPELPSKRARLDDQAPGDEDEDEFDRPRGGIGSSSRSSASVIDQNKGTTSSTNTSGGRGRIEPIRISMWSGRKGLSARLPSPPPLPPSTSNRDPDALDPKKLERLGRETEGFRERQRNEWSVKERERKGRAAREKLVALDVENGIKFHPLHILPFDPLSTIPKPLLRLIYPAQVFSPSPSPEPHHDNAAPPEPIVAYKDGSNLSAAEKMREQMRSDMLSDLHGVDYDDNDDEGVVRFGILSDESKNEIQEIKKANNENGEKGSEGVKWEDMVPGAKRVLAMDPETYLNFVVDQLRHEYLFCFWCAYRYSSYEEMEESGGCPGEEEDDH